MTVSTTTSRVEYAGNGSTTAFSVPFYFLANGDLKAYKANTLQTITTHYTVSGAGNPAGGTVTFLSAPATGQAVVILRDPALTQNTDYVPNDPFPAESHERALDRLTMIAQRNRDLIDRAFVLPDGVTGVSTDLPVPEANKVIAWDSNGTALQNRDATDFATALTYADRRVETFTGNGTTVDFALAETPAVIANTDVDIEGVSQVPGVDYQLLADGVTIRFDVAPPNGQAICVKYGQAVAQSRDDAATVHFAPAGTGAVSRTVQAKLRDVVSVKDFGAIGDGTTDDTTAIQAAINSGAKAVYFPASTYIATQLTLVSNQKLYGDGHSKSVVSWAQSNILSPTRNMFVSAGDVSNIEFCDLGFRGNLLSQTTSDNTGQNLMCFKFRAGSVQNAAWRNCKIYEFGDQSKSGGAGILIGPNTGSGKSIENIIISDCVFQDIANVPGVYVGAVNTYVSYANGIKVTNNVFRNTVNYADQNCIFILGDASISVVDVVASKNEFDIQQSIDAAIEINYSKNVNVESNQVYISGSANADAILIRSKVTDFIVAENVIQNVGSGCATHAGIILLQHTTSEVQQRGVVSGNTITGFGSTSGKGIMVGSGCRSVVISQNVIEGVSSGTPTTYGMQAYGSQDIIISDNVLRHCSIGLEFSTGDGGITRATVENNRFDACGKSGDWAINTNSVGITATNICVRNNFLTNAVAGTSGFYSPAFAAATGNTVYDNETGLTEVNASYVSKVTWRTILRATWAQGSISMSDGQGFLIPGGGQNVAGAALGDAVVVGVKTDLQGVTVTGYVSAANTVQVRVQNESGGSVTIAAADWTVQVLKK